MPLTRILVIEDHDDTREALRIFLEASGYAVSSASDQRSALEALEPEPPAVVLMDCNVSADFDAERFVFMIRSRNIKSTVILVSGMADVKHYAHTLGITHVLAKPFDVDDLLELLKKCCS